jgi:hypothetical protein
VTGGVCLRMVRGQRKIEIRLATSAALQAMKEAPGTAGHPQLEKFLLPTRMAAIGRMGDLRNEFLIPR